MQDEAQPIRDRRARWAIAIALCALILFIYGGVGQHQVVDFDDYEYVVDNPYRDGHLSGEDLRRAFAEPYKSNWAPLMSISLATSDALLVVLWSTLALFAKATAVAIPVTLLLLDLWPLHRIKTPRDFLTCALEKLPAAAAAIGVSAITLLSQTASGANTSAYTPLLLRVLNAARAYRIYLADTFWPNGLAYYYPYPSDAVLSSPASWSAAAPSRSFLRSPSSRSDKSAPGATPKPSSLMPSRSRSKTHTRIASWASHDGPAAINAAVKSICGRRSRFVPNGATHGLCWRRRCSKPAAWTRQKQNSASQVNKARRPNWLGPRGASLHNSRAARGKLRRPSPRALELGSEDWQVLNNLAWICAASQEASLRDPVSAVVLAERAASVQPENPFILGTLAAAYASAGQRKAAVDAQTRAVARLEQEQAPNVRALLPGFRDRIDRYRRGLPAWSTGPAAEPER